MKKNDSHKANAAFIKTMGDNSDIVSYSDSETESERSTYLCASVSKLSNKSWGLDSMCSCHLTPFKDAFISNIIPIRVPIEVANGTIIYARGKGDVRIHWKKSTFSRHTRSTILRDVLYVPDASISLISLGMLSEKGQTFTCNSSDLMIYANDGKLLFRGNRQNKVWVIPEPKELASSSTSRADLLHERLGHPGRHITMRIPKAVNGINLNEDLKFNFCRPCKEAKITRTVSRQPMRDVSRPLERVHIDLCGPFRTRSWHGKRYMLTITDQFTKFKWAFFQRDKKDIVKQIKKWHVKVEKDRDLYGNKEKLLAIRIDRGTEFLNRDMKDWTSFNNIDLEPTIGYRPEANGIAERANRTIIEKGNSMRFRAGLPAEFWEMS
ncbi:hypothetical protein K3495_g14657, partial [Podosphaera aphanis]